MQCTGTETSLLQCETFDANTRDCRHFEDAGVICYTGGRYCACMYFFVHKRFLSWSGISSLILLYFLYMYLYCLDHQFIHQCTYTCIGMYAVQRIFMVILYCMRALCVCVCVVCACVCVCVSVHVLITQPTRAYRAGTPCISTIQCTFN